MVLEVVDGIEVMGRGGGGGGGGILDEVDTRKSSGPYVLETDAGVAANIGSGPIPGCIEDCIGKGENG